MIQTIEAPRQVTKEPTASLYARRGKRLVDLVVGSTLVLLVLPVLLVTALTLRVTLGPGIMLRQPRVGQHGRVFGCLKFRTMNADRRANETSEWWGNDRRVTHKSDEDPRHTRLGRLLRKFSIDELPQLFNLIKGDMSLVGPRPELDLVACPEFRSHPRHLVRPGLTGPFQLSPLRSRGSLEDGLGYDELYLRRQSLSYDLGILLRTATAVARGTGR